jgi:hypothetical protein
MHVSSSKVQQLGIKETFSAMLPSCSEEVQCSQNITTTTQCCALLRGHQQHLENAFHTVQLHWRSAQLLCFVRITHLHCHH